MDTIINYKVSFTSQNKTISRSFLTASRSTWATTNKPVQLGGVIPAGTGQKRRDPVCPWSPSAEPWDPRDNCAACPLSPLVTQDFSSGHSRTRLVSRYINHLRQAGEKTLQLDWREKKSRFTAFDVLNILPVWQNIEILVWKTHARINRCSHKITLNYYPYRAAFIKEEHIFIKTKLIHP